MKIERIMLTKIVKLDNLVQKMNELRGEGQRIVFTNGCFDILHVGHVRYLAAAKAEGDVLIIGLNSDESVRFIKHKNRPLVSQNHRAEVLASLECVDYITIFDEPNPLELIQSLKPDVLVKGADWKEKDIIGADVVKARGGKIVRVPVVPDISTSKLIQKIIESSNL